MTVSTFFPDGDPETTSVDGFAQRVVAASTWASIRGDAGDFARDNGTLDVSPRIRTDATDWDLCSRAIFLFDTGSLPDGDSLDSATFELVLTATVDDFTASVSLVPSTPATNTALVPGDYQQLGTTKQATDRTIAGLTVDSSTYNAWTLNAAGLASIDAAGISKFGTRITADNDDNEPGFVAFNESRTTFAPAEEVLTDDKRPRLVVTHSAPPAVADVPVAGIGQMAGASPIQIETTMVGT